LRRRWRGTCWGCRRQTQARGQTRIAVTEVEAAAGLAGEALDDGEPEPGALGAGARRVAAPEGALGGVEFGVIQPRAHVDHAETERVCRALELQRHRRRTVAMGVFQQVGKTAPQALRRHRPRTQRAAQRYRQVACREARDELAAQRIEIDGTGGLHAGACERRELAGQRFHVVHVADHRLAFAGVVDLHFDRQAQAGERGAQIVREAGEQQRTVGFLRAEVSAHAVEGARQRGQFVRPRLIQAGREIAAADATGDCGRLAQRAVDAFHHGPAAGEGQQQGQCAPAYPLPGQAVAVRRARQHQPVFVGAERKADPQGLVVVRIGDQQRVLAQLRLQCLPDAPLHAVLGRRQGELLRFHRHHADALALRQFLQQRQTAFGLCGQQCCARELDDGGGAGGDLARARFLLGQREQREPGREADDQQAADQDDGARQQGIRRAQHQSGMNT